MTTSFSANDQRGAQQINLDDIPVLTDVVDESISDVRVTRGATRYMSAIDDAPFMPAPADPMLASLAEMLVDSIPDDEIEAMIAEEDKRIVFEAVRAVRKMYNRRKRQRRARTGRK